MVIERDVRHAGVWVVRGYYGFAADTHFNILGDDIEVPAGAEIQWVESRRYSPRSVPNLLARYGLQLLEEQQFSRHGLCLCQRAR